jgi:hypothetical protein
MNFDMHFITFGTQGLYQHHARELARSAIDVAGFSTVRVYDEERFDESFKESHAEVLKVKRGFGLWAWKSFFILQRLNELRDGEILIYSNSLYAFKRDIRPSALEWLKDRDLVLFENKPSEPCFIEKNWAKHDAFHILGADPEVHGETPHAWAGFLIVRKTPATLRFVKEWYDHCADIRMMGDGPSIFGQELPEFIENRHDQTAISIMSKVSNIGYPFLTFPADLLYNVRVGR